MSTISTRLLWALPLLALSLVFGAPQEGSARGPACTDSYLVCINDALDGGAGLDGAADELGSIECAASWAGCVFRRFRVG
jgi:hypothetical protein